MLPPLPVVVLEEQKHSSRNSLSPYQVLTQASCCNKSLDGIQERCVSLVRNPSVFYVEKLQELCEKVGGEKYIECTTKC